MRTTLVVERAFRDCVELGGDADDTPSLYLWRNSEVSVERVLEAVESGKPQILACPPRPGQPRAMRCVVIGMGLAGAGPNAEGATAPRSGVPLRSAPRTQRPPAPARGWWPAAVAQ